SFFPPFHGNRSEGGTRASAPSASSDLGTWWQRHGKKKAIHKTTATDDKRLQRTLKRVGVNTVLGIKEVSIVKDDIVIQF
uniref:Nascent polypeptide-associated complex subunit beta n=1 Tax=Triticum urartu TaxID=4572 RepID=A0A8R7R3C0_TRIUA